MTLAVSSLPIGLGGDGALRWLAAPGVLPPVFSGGPSLPTGLGAIGRRDGARAGGGRTTIRGRAKHAVASGGGEEWWTAVCDDRPHPDNPDWPAKITLTVGGVAFVLTTNAVKHMAERMPAKSKSLSDADWNRPWSGADGLDFPLSSIAGSLEKLAARLPSKAKKHHTGLIVDDWELGVTTEETPWRVTHAVYKPE